MYNNVQQLHNEWNGKGKQESQKKAVSAQHR
jgi:hypothetical protein